MPSKHESAPPSATRKEAEFVRQHKDELSKSYTHVPSEQWSSFFDNFSRDKLGVPMNVDVETPGLGCHELAHNSPLVGITASNEHGQELSIELILGPGTAGHQSHTIHAPQRVTVIPAPDARSFCMEIEAHNGEVVSVRWHEPERCDCR